MEKRITKSKKFIIIETILLVLIISLLNTSYYFKNKILTIDKSMIDEYNSLKENQKDKEKELTKLNNYYIEYSNIDNKINSIKEEYFKYIKNLENDIISGKSNKKIAYLTFDDGPYYNTYKVLDILDKYNIKATFFTTTTNGTYCYDNRSYECFKLYPEYVKRGHTIANHTYTHAIRYGLYNSADLFIKAVKDQEEHVKKYAYGYITNIVRFPGGSSTARSLKSPIIEKLRENHYGYVDWNGYDGDGGMLSSKDETWNNFISTINEKIEVILYHDYSRYTTALLPEMITYLKENGYILLPLFYESVMIKK